MTSELKPCPHCNGEVECYEDESKLRPGVHVYRVECWNEDCPSKLSHDRKSDAIKSWNTRVTEVRE